MRCGFVRHVVEEETHRHVKDLADVPQAGRADPVASALVLLHLLESDIEGIAEPFLAHSQERAPKPEPAADMNIARVVVRYLVVRVVPPSVGIYLWHEHN